MTMERSANEHSVAASGAPAYEARWWLRFHRGADVRRDGQRLLYRPSPTKSSTWRPLPRVSDQRRQYAGASSAAPPLLC